MLGAEELRVRHAREARGRRRSASRPVTFAQASTLGSRCPMTDRGRSRALLTASSRRRPPSDRRPARRRRGSSCTRAAAEVPGERGPDRVAVGPRRRVEQGAGGEEDPGRAVPALRGPQLREGLLERVRAVALGEALDGQDLARPGTRRRSARQESIGWPSTSTVQVPHSPSSQPCFVPGSAEVLARAPRGASGGRGRRRRGAPGLR
mgnify:CR=1 FL=1